jgi:uncharacterized protein
MRIISNTSPILNLAIIGQLDLLCQQFTQIHIPPAVLSELKIDEDRPGSMAIQEAVAAGWIQVLPVSNLSLVQLLRQTLDAGESEAIALALEVSATWTILDERDARKAAKSLGLQVTGVLGVLIQAKRSGKLTALEPAVEALVQKAGFRLAPELLAMVLKA